MRTKRLAEIVERKSPKLYNYFKLIRHSNELALSDEDINNFKAGKKPFWIDYQNSFEPRYGNGNPPHNALNEIISARKESYARFIDESLKHLEHFRKFEVDPMADPSNYSWENGYFAGMDAVALYTMLSSHKPEKYVEVGSGYSTLLARQAIDDNKLPTEIISIDPQPRTEVDSRCDTTFRTAMQDMDISFFKDIEPGNILFIDSSHVSLLNSDVSVFFLDVLPVLQPGVLIHIHDIMLPWDYSAEFGERLYSEQYLLAVYLLCSVNRYEILFPSHFIGHDNELFGGFRKICDLEKLRNLDIRGSSFWFKKTSM